MGWDLEVGGASMGMEFEGRRGQAWGRSLEVGGTRHGDVVWR